VAVTFDDFYTLRYPAKEKEDIIYPTMRALRNYGLDLKGGFLEQYFRADKSYRDKLEKTMRESLLDDIVVTALMACNFRSKAVFRIARDAVTYGLATRKTRWFPDAKDTLAKLRNKGYKLGLISNTHWRMLENSQKEFRKFFDVITLSYELGYAKPHPLIFITTLKKLGVNANCCLHVGDDPIADIEGAKAVGMKAAFVKRREMEAEADITIKRLSELVTFL
jgi:HAD superfamily hydrolase (TIGR01549 family)